MSTMLDRSKVEFHIGNECWLTMTRTEPQFKIEPHIAMHDPVAWPREAHALAMLLTLHEDDLAKLLEAIYQEEQERFIDLTPDKLIKAMHKVFPDGKITCWCYDEDDALQPSLQKFSVETVKELIKIGFFDAERCRTPDESLRALLRYGKRLYISKCSEALNIDADDGERKGIGGGSPSITNRQLNALLDEMNEQLSEYYEYTPKRKRRMR